MRRPFSALTGALLAFAFAAGCTSSAAQNNATAAPPAALTLRYAHAERADDTLTIERDAAGQVRAEEGDGQFIIIRDGIIYLNPQPPGGGERVIARLEDYLAVGAELRANMVRGGAMQDGPDTTAYRLVDQGPAGVGQWRGRRYELDPEGPGVTLSAIISDDPALAGARTLAAAVLEARTRLEGAVLVFPEQYVRLEAELRGRGMPIMWDHQELRSVSTDPVPASRFELPGPVLSRDALRARLMPAAPAR